MDLYPAIDLRGGRCVRLQQGDYDKETVYFDDPVAVAESFIVAGAAWIHVVDLDAARSGQPVNRPVIAAIVRCTSAKGVKVQTGGGVRSVADAAALAKIGVSRAVMGTAAIRDPEIVGLASSELPIAIGLDHRGGEVAVHGWTEGTGIKVRDVIDRSSPHEVSAFVVTEIGRDGMLTGPDVDGLAAAVARTTIPVIASGGVGSLDDLVRLRRELPGLSGVICGKAIYEGRVNVAEGVAALRGSDS